MSLPPSDPAAADALMRRLPPDVMRALNPEQRAALMAALAAPVGRYPVSLRFTLPLTRFFIAIIGGRERRGPDRRALERLRHPLITLGNIVFVGVLTCLFTFIAAVATLFYSSILEL
jgi:hypothetical protein